MSNRENYCRLIGLNPIKESKYSYEDIEKKITEKETKWKKENNDKQNDLEKRFQFGKNLELMPDIKKVMKNPVLRSTEFEDGRKLLKSKASKLSKDSIILHDGSKLLIGGTAESLLKKIQWEDVTKDDLVTLAGIRKVTLSPIVGPKVTSAYKGLQEVRAHTPASILSDLINNSGLEINHKPLSENCSISQLKSAFELCEKRINTIRHELFPNRDSYIQSLRALKITLNDDNDLTSLIKYGQCKQVLIPAMAQMEEDYGQPFSREYIDNILNIYLKNTNADRDMCILILEEFCFKKKYLANFSNKDSKLIICHNCSSLVESGSQIMCCSVCGFSIKTCCPKCGIDQSSGNSACIKCGFDFEQGLEKAKALEEKFKNELDNGNIERAAFVFKDLQKAYSTYPDINILEDRLNTVSRKHERTVKMIGQYFALKKYYEVKEYCDSSMDSLPRLLVTNYDVKKKYDESVIRISEADEICLTAKKTTDKEEMMLLYVAASERCPDHPLAKKKMEEHPPDSPADASIQIIDSRALIKYAVPENRSGMTFCIYRNEDSVPIVEENTLPLAEIPGGVYLDKTMDPGVDYFYSIHSKRWGILSREATLCGPAAIFLEVDKVFIEPIPDGLKITYEIPKGCTRVRIWRKEGSSAAGTGEEVELQHNGELVINDYGLKGDKKYHYLFVAEYLNGGKTERSLGADYSCTTVRFPEPVRDMDIKWNKNDGSYTARWGTKETVKLYYSPKKVTLYGRMINIEDVESWMSEIQPIEILNNGMRFFLPDGAVQYIYPMIPIGKTAVKGRETLVANLKPFRDVEKKMSGNDCDITMIWPDDAESAVVVVKDSTPATDPDDVNAERITVTREGYNKDKMIRIPMGNSKKRVMTLYAVYDISGDKTMSRGMSIDVYSGKCAKVKYTMSLKKDSKTNSIMIIDFETDVDTLHLPPMKAVCVKKGIPLKIWDGEGIWSSEEPIELNNGKASISFTCLINIEPANVRLFFTNEEDYNLLRFIHPIYKGGN